MSLDYPDYVIPPSQADLLAGFSCPKCESLESQTIREDDGFEHYQCQGCGHSWTQDDPSDDRDNQQEGDP